MTAGPELDGYGTDRLPGGWQPAAPPCDHAEQLDAMAADLARLVRTLDALVDTLGAKLPFRVRVALSAARQGEGVDRGRRH